MNIFLIISWITNNTMSRINKLVIYIIINNNVQIFYYFVIILILNLCTLWTLTLPSMDVDMDFSTNNKMLHVNFNIQYSKTTNEKKPRPLFLLYIW